MAQARLTPGLLRLDLKCGQGAISQGEKCTKGMASKVQRPGPKGRRPTSSGTKPPENAQQAALTVGLIGAAGLVAFATRKKWTPAAQKAFDNAKAVLPMPGTAPTVPKGSTFVAKGFAGAIYKAKDGKSVFKVNFKRDVKGRRQFLHEMAMQSKIADLGVRTPKVISVNPKRSIAQMEYMDGYSSPTADSLITKKSPVPRDEYFRKLVGQLEILHRGGYGHGDLHFGNTMVKKGDVAVIDWGYVDTVEAKGMKDIDHLLWMTNRVSSPLHTKIKEAAVDLKQSKRKQQDFASFYDRLNAALGRTDSIRVDLKCGKGAISKGEKCTKGPTTKRKSQVSNQTWGQLGAGLLIGGLTVAGAARALKRPGEARKPRPMFRVKVTAKQAPRPGGPAPRDRQAANNPGVDPDAWAKSKQEAEQRYGQRRQQWQEADRQRQQQRQQQSREAESKYQEAWSNYRRKTGAPSNISDPFKELNIPSTATYKEARAAYLKAARTHHPDAGGDVEKMKKINTAWEEIQKRLGRTDSMWVLPIYTRTANVSTHHVTL